MPKKESVETVACPHTETEISIDDCVAKSSDLFINELSCSGKDCVSGGRVCPACLKKKIPQPENGDRSLFYAIGGEEELCETHLVNGENADPARKQVSLKDVILVKDVGAAPLVKEKKSPMKEINEVSDKNIVMLKVSEIIPNPEQPRTKFKSGSINALARDLKDNGANETLKVIRVEIPGKPEIKYMIADGERRWRGAKIGGLEEIPGVIKKIKGEPDLFAYSFSLNFGREEMTPFETAKAIRRLRKKYNFSVEEIAKMANKELYWVYRHLALTKLCDRVLEFMDDSLPKGKRLNFSTAVRLAELPNDVLQVRTAKKILRDKLKTTTAYQLIDRVKAENGLAPKFSPDRERKRFERHLIDSLRVFGHILFLSEEDFTKLYKNIGNKKREAIKNCLQELAQRATKLKNKI